MEERYNTVIKIEVTGAEPNYLSPWKTGAQKEWSGSGFAIQGKRIMTNHHVVNDAFDIRVRKHGSSKRYMARFVQM